MNTPLLRRIQRQIDKSPERFLMGQRSSRVACGTAFCIGGWAHALTETELNPGMYLAQEPLGLTDDEAYRLIWMHQWPQQFRGPDDGSEEAAARAIRRIEHFIQTEGRE
jgi:hypothetical protein